MVPRSPTPGSSVPTARPAGDVDPGRRHTACRRRDSTPALLLVVASSVVASQALVPPALQAQAPVSESGGGGEAPLPVSGAAIPSHLAGLEATLLRYLAAWNDDDPASVLEHLSPGVGVLTRSGLVEAGAVRELLGRVVPRVRLLGASIYMVDAADGWVSVGTLLEMEMDPQVDDGGPRLGSATTVWERGPDDRWRVVFLGALWIRSEEGRVVAGPRRIGSADLPADMIVGTNSLAPPGRDG